MKKNIPYFYIDYISYECDEDAYPLREANNMGFFSSLLEAKKC